MTKGSRDCVTFIKSTFAPVSSDALKTLYFDLRRLETTLLNCGIIGIMQALQTLLFITAMAPLSWGELRLFDGLSGQWQALKLPPLEGCPVCGENNADYS